jgi:hypothetical protein
MAVTATVRVLAVVGSVTVVTMTATVRIRHGVLVGPTRLPVGGCLIGVIVGLFVFIGVTVVGLFVR